MSPRHAVPALDSVLRFVPSLMRCPDWQIHDLYDYEAQPFLLGYQNEEKIRKQGLKKGDFDFKHVIGVSMFGHISLAKHKVLTENQPKIC